MSEERSRHLGVPGVGLAGVFGIGARRHRIGEPGIAFGVPGGEPCGSARAQPVNRGADDDIGQRHPFGGADDGGREVHVTTPFVLISAQTHFAFVASEKQSPRLR